MAGIKERLAGYGLTLEPDVVICDRRTINEAVSRIAKLEAEVERLRKALGMMLKEHDILSGNFGDVMDPKHKRPDRWPTAAEAARRALEGGGDE